MKNLKSIIITIGFCMIFNVLQAKDSTQKHWGIYVSTGIYPSIKAAYFLSEPKKFMAYLPYYPFISILTPSVTYTSGSHYFSLGPRLLAPDKPNQQFSGEFTYEYLKKRPEKKVNHAFGTDIIYTYAFRSGEFNSNQKNVSYSMLTHQILLHGTMGLRRYLNNNFYFNASTGIGVALTKYRVKYDTIVAPEYTRENRNDGFFHKPLLNTMLKVGFGYNFIKK